MSGELIGVIAAAIALGTLNFLQSRSNRNDARRESSLLREELGIVRAQVGTCATQKGLDGLRAEMNAGTDTLRAEMKTGFDGLRAELKAGDDALRAEMKAGDEALRAEMKAGDEALRAEMKAGDVALRGEIGGLRADMQTGFKELNTRVGTVEQRLAKVEGVIEGLFLSGRAEPSDQPRAGAA